MSKVCINLAEHSNPREALNRAFRRDPDVIIFIGSNPEMENLAIEAGHEVTVLPVGSTCPNDASPISALVSADESTLKRLDEIAREAWAGKYDRVGVLSSGEVLYVALASGRMRELAPSDSIAYAVDRVGPEWMHHMLTVWKSSAQPKN